MISVSFLCFVFSLQLFHILFNRLFQIFIVARNGCFVLFADTKRDRERKRGRESAKCFRTGDIIIFVSA